MVQATCVGINNILQYRKAFLQRQAENTGCMPEGREALNMRDHVKAAGGVAFDNLMAATVHSDDQMARMVAILAGRVPRP